MKNPRRVALIVMMAAVVCLLVGGLLFLPSSVEGVYDPLSISSTMGCDCDQFVEFHAGKTLFHVLEKGPSFVESYYEEDDAGVIWIKSRAHGLDPTDKVYGRAEPHLLFTKFIYSNGSSDWRWKRYVTGAMKAKMKNTEIIDSSDEEGGTRFTTYDSDFNVIKSRLIPKPISGPK